jgi:hypothetical protein
MKEFCKKNLFSIKENITFLNTAYQSPKLKSSEIKGKEGITLQMNPYLLEPKDFFIKPYEIKKKFSKLIKNDDFYNISIMTSVSYAVSTIIKNIKNQVTKKNNVVLLEEQFPSDYYAWYKLCNEVGCELRIVKYDKNLNKIGKKWNEGN